MKLAKNATVAVIAPASVPSIAGLDAGVALLREWGLRVLEGRHLRTHFPYHAVSIAQRTEDLLWALTDPQIDIVWFARGGYGSAQCLPSLPPDLGNDRIIIGFSDATSLFCALRKRGHQHLIHGPMVEFLATDSDEQTRQAISALLSGNARPNLIGDHLCGPQETVSAPLIGGNLAVLASIAGTPWTLPGEGAIVLLEDITEHAYRIDRMILQLRASGFFEGIKGLALGEFIRCMLPPDASFTLEQMLVELLEPLGVPVVHNIGVGHGARNLAWRVGERVSLRDGSLYFCGDDFHPGPSGSTRQ
ncbi:MAG: LD-carboxypeptidase [Burkholderiaceae bacterium]